LTDFKLALVLVISREWLACSVRQPEVAVYRDNCHHFKPPDSYAELSFLSFISRNADLCIIATANLSVCPSRHIPVFCSDERRYDRAVFSSR